MDRKERDRVAEATAAWDARLRAPGSGAEDRRRFAEWRDADPAHAEAFERLQIIVDGLRREQSRADLRAIRDAALLLVQRRRRNARWTLAASAAGLALAAALWTLLPRLEVFDSVDTYRTGIGQRSSITLQDGSTVELNSTTRIHVSFSGNQRSVELLEGQALFDVATDANRPFVVHAGGREVVAIGTEFDVRLDPSSVRVTLLEGKVAVVPEGSSNALGLPVSVTSAPRKAARNGAAEGSGTPEAAGTVFLSPGQQLIAARGAVGKSSSATARSQPFTVREIDVEKVTGWRVGRVFLEDLTLAEAVVEMNKHSVVQITVGDRPLKDLRISGMFRAGEQQAFAHALEEYFPIVAERRDEAQIVLTPRR